uniref:Uncharacterized protein n=1 Tax=Avena sativa TaxID=4498 RepID=A0ACD5W6U4_AVESA
MSSCIMQVIRLGYKSVAHYLIATQRAGASSGDSSSADSSNELPSTDVVSEHAPVVKQGLEYAGDICSKVMNAKNEGNKKAAAKGEITRAKAPGKRISDVCKDDSRSESGVTFDSVNCQANQDNGCVTVTPSKPEPKKRKKLVERSPDCVASRLRSRSAKS